MKILLIVSTNVSVNKLG